jgi:predicted DNA-binding transcriptional regulator YafY
LPVRRVDSPQETIQQLAPQLSRIQARLLADAVEHGTPIRIEYTNAQGTPSRRVIEPLDLDGHLLEAFCHLRDDERVFALDRIESVSPA